MRKWMRERLQRRKPKTPAEKPATEPTQEPLQPTYYETQEPEAVESPAPERSTQNEPQVVSEPSGDAAPAPRASRSQTEDDRPRRRRRRGRGGRGRGSAQPAAPLQPTLMREQESAPTRAEPEPIAA